MCRVAEQRHAPLGGFLGEFLGGFLGGSRRCDLGGFLGGFLGPRQRLAGLNVTVVRRVPDAIITLKTMAN